MKIQFLGVGSQFSGHEQYHSNIIITAQSGKRMLIDCGGDARFSMAESGINPTDIDAVYISHLHSDHVGGLEWFTISNYFGQEKVHPKLFCEEELQNRLWNHTLKGGLECIGNKSMELSDYFNCLPQKENGFFSWEEIRFELIKMPHITGPACERYSYGLHITSTKDKSYAVFISTDTIFQPDLLQEISEDITVIFHDCETVPTRTAVHAHYEQLRTLPVALKQKIWLYHHQLNSGYNPQKDGFQGFVVKGQKFYFPE